MAPVPPGQAHIAVEQAADSSRNFVLRLEVRFFVVRNWRAVAWYSNPVPVLLGFHG